MATLGTAAEFAERASRLSGGGRPPGCCVSLGQRNNVINNISEIIVGEIIAKSPELY